MKDVPDLRPAWHITPQQFMQHLEPKQSFKPIYKDYSEFSGYNSGYQGRDIWKQLLNDTYNHQEKTGEGSYGAYFLYEANNVTKQFKIASLVNVT